MKLLEENAGETLGDVDIRRDFKAIRWERATGAKIAKMRFYQSEKGSKGGWSPQRRLR